MMQNIMNVNAESRKEVGKKISKKLRKEGRVPAIIYGGDRESIPISLLMSDLKQILKAEMGENTILRILRDDLKVDAMLKQIQYDHLSESIIHVDFIRIDLTKPIEVNVPVEIIGESIGVRLEEGIFDFINRELKIWSIPDKIPKAIEVDVSDLHIGHSIKVEELDIAEDIEFLSDPQTVICAVSVKGMVEEEVVEEEVEEEVEGEEGEGEAKDKDEKADAKGKDEKADAKGKDEKAESKQDKRQEAPKKNE
jgi:large subunit ribosomal protein L25